MDYNRLLRCLAIYKKAENDDHGFGASCLTAIKILMVNKEMFGIDSHQKPKTEAGKPPARSAMDLAEKKGNWEVYNWLKNRSYSMSELKNCMQFVLGDLHQQVVWVAEQIRIPGITAAVKEQQYFQACKLLIVHDSILFNTYGDDLYPQPSGNNAVNTATYRAQAYEDELRDACKENEGGAFLLYLLLDNRARLNFDINTADQDKNTLLHIAAKHSRYKIYASLIEFGMKDHMENKWGITPRQIAEQTPPRAGSFSNALTTKNLEQTKAHLQAGMSTERYIHNRANIHGPALTIVLYEQNNLQLVVEV
jgi:hypothetical protein